MGSYLSSQQSRFRITPLIVFLLSTSALALPPQKAPTTPEQWQQATQGKTESPSVQISFPRTILDREDDVLADMHAKIPVEFPDLKLNTIGRKPHDTLLLLNDATIDDVRELARLFKKLDRKTLEHYGLFGPVSVIDFENPEIIIVGRQSKFGAIHASKEFIEWHRRFLVMVSELAPSLYQKFLDKFGLKNGDATANNSHISLVQWGKRHGLDLTPEQERQVVDKLSAMFKRSIEEYKQRHGKLPSLIFDLQTTPIEFVRAPFSFQFAPMAQLGYKLGYDGQPIVSQVGRLMVSEPIAENAEIDPEMADAESTLIEYDVEQLLNGDAAPYTTGEREGRVLENSRKEFTPMPLDQFKTLLSQRGAKAFEIGLRTLSPSLYPAAVPTAQESMKDLFFVTHFTHKNLAPQKVQKTLMMVNEVGLKSTPEVSLGLAIYASSGRQEVKNPGDADVLINALIQIPDSVQDFESARDMAAKIFVRDVLGQLTGLAQKGRIAITELRMGSDAAMGLGDKHSLAARESNPYLSQDDVIKGSFTDKTGKTWTLEELFKLGEFTKGKIDYFRSSGREDISLQFVAGIQWRNQVIYLHQDALKGVPPLLRTGIYYGADSFAVAAALSRPAAYYAVQKGPMLPRAIHDLISSMKSKEKAPVNAEPLWNAKFVKKVYNFLILLGAGPLRQDEVFFSEVRRLMETQGTWREGYSIEEFVNHVVNAINVRQLKLLNAFRRNINDFSEYNERQQTFTLMQWYERLRETDKMVGELTTAMRNGDLVTTADFDQKFASFRKAFSEARQQPKIDDAIAYLRHASRYADVHDFEVALLKLEGQIEASGISKKGLSRYDTMFVKTFVAYAPHIYYRYLMTRAPLADTVAKDELRFMGIDPTPENIARMEYLAQHFDELARADLAQLQTELFSQSKAKVLKPSPCEFSLDPNLLIK